MNEDETFKRLRQLPFKDMSNVYFSVKGNMKLRISEQAQLLETHGWTLAEFINEYNNVFDNKSQSGFVG